MVDRTPLDGLPSRVARIRPAPPRRGTSQRTESVAVLGAGIQGVCAALELARRGCRVDLYECEARPLGGASLWNEGKVHLGLIFAGDRASRTARVLAGGSMRFASGLARWGVDVLAEGLSEPFTYAVHRDSILSVESIERHFAAVEATYRELRDALGERYLGAHDEVVYERLPQRELEASYDPALVVAAFATIERSVDPERLARRLRDAIAAEPRVRLLVDRRVESVVRDGDARLRVISSEGGSCHGADVDRYGHVVNALWGDRLRVDAALGLAPRRRWSFRFKLALHVDQRVAMASPPPSTTLLLGEFGDIVTFDGRRIYLSWYPACLLGTTSELAPNGIVAGVDDATRDRVFANVLERLSAVVPSLPAAEIERCATTVEGGVIFTWGDTRITDPASEVHRRFDIGVRSCGRYHSIDTGKYCMAPLFALEVADRVRPEG